MTWREMIYMIPLGIAAWLAFLLMPFAIMGGIIYVIIDTVF